MDRIERQFGLCEWCGFDSFIDSINYDDGEVWVALSCVNQECDNKWKEIFEFAFTEYDEREFNTTCSEGVAVVTSRKYSVTVSETEEGIIVDVWDDVNAELKHTNCFWDDDVYGGV